MEEISSILAKRKIRLQETLINIEEFDVTAKRISHEVQVLRSDFEAVLPVCIDWRVLERQMQEQKVNKMIFFYSLF